MTRVLLAAAFLLLNVAAHAGEPSKTITISDLWMRASLGRVPTTAAYVKIENRGTTEDKLLAVSTPAAAKAHIHNSVTTDAGVAQMLAVTALSVKPGEKVDLTPGAMHIMIMNLKAPLKAGAMVPMTFKFEQAGEITVEAEVRGLDGQPHKH